MPTVTFIFGLCGSGKTRLAERIIAPYRILDGWGLGQAAEDKIAELLAALRDGQDAVVIEVSLCASGEQKKILGRIAGLQDSNVHVRWIGFDNDKEAANRNCANRRDAPRKLAQLLEHNDRLSRAWSKPDGAIILRTWQGEVE